MSKGMIIDEDKNRGTVTYLKIDEITGKEYFHTEQKIDSVLNSTARITEMEETSWKKNNQLVAMIPQNIINDWFMELGEKDPLAKENAAWLMGKLNSPEFSRFRTKTGKI